MLEGDEEGKDPVTRQLEGVALEKGRRDGMRNSCWFRIDVFIREALVWPLGHISVSREARRAAKKSDRV